MSLAFFPVLSSSLVQIFVFGRDLSTLFDGGGLAVVIAGFR